MICGLTASAMTGSATRHRMKFMVILGLKRTFLEWRPLFGRFMA
jgi:hypothetical protein